MHCPFLEEISMVYCRAYPVKKLIPRHMVTTTSPCMGKGYQSCPFFLEIVARQEEVPRRAETALGREDQQEGGVP